MISFSLITHPRELNRSTNTGKLIAHFIPEQTQRLVWERKKNFEDLDKITSSTSTHRPSHFKGPNVENCFLVYPKLNDALPLSRLEPSCSNHYVLIDATWQESNKIYNKSQYLQALPQVCLEPKKASIYTLRRNQRNAGLCTAECVLELLEFHNDIEQTARIHSALLKLMMAKKTF